MISGNQYQEDVETLELLNSQKSILLYNDEVNTFVRNGMIIDTLCKYCDHDVVQAEQCAWIKNITTENVWLKKVPMKNLNPICNAKIRDIPIKHIYNMLYDYIWPRSSTE